MTPPNWLKSVAWAALIWNLLGVMAFAIQMLMTQKMISQLPLEQQAAYANTPLWYSFSFATAVFAGTAGCILLLSKNALARELFLASLIAILIQQYYNFIVIDSINMFGLNSLFMPILVIFIAALLLFLSYQGKRSGWLS